MDELLEQFLIEGRDLVAQASADFAALLERSDDAEAIDGAFRAIHTLKGSVAIFAMAPAERVLHAAESILESAKLSSSGVDGEQVQALVACLDQIDRWIDDMESGSALSDGADLAADHLSALLLGQPKLVAAAPPAADDALWAAPIAERYLQSSETSPVKVTVFRYTPAEDCFFRGEDPLAIAMAVPGPVSLDVLPASGKWPEAGEIMPFSCVSVLEGVSADSVEAVRAAFRLVPDQVAISAVAPSSAANVGAASRAGQGADVLRVPSVRIDAMADGLGELIVAVNSVAGLRDDAALVDRTLAARLQAVQAKLEQVTGRLHRNLSAVRAVSVASALRRLPRLVREIADAVGKRVSFSIDGGELEVDKQIADGLFEPLLHLLRNAIDHGAETPALRTDAGKTPDCRITLAFSRRGDSIEIVLADDGAGIDADRIRGAAVARGLLAPGEADLLSDAEALRLIFLPGFSTSETVTSVSGRGVGMDAVQAAVARLHGTLAIESIVGQGTTLRMRLKAGALTTALLVVMVGDERYGVALDQIAETSRVSQDALRAIGTGQACVLRGRTLPVVDLGALISGAQCRDPLARLLITQAGGDRVAVRVDGFGERLAAFVRPAAGMLAKVPGVTGSTMTGDGSVLLVLDLPELLA